MAQEPYAWDFWLSPKEWESLVLQVLEDQTTHKAKIIIIHHSEKFEAQTI